MQRFLILFFAVTLISSQTVWKMQPSEARQGCCSHHGGVNGCTCKDGTSLSDKCRPYYPQCQTAGATPFVPTQPSVPSHPADAHHTAAPQNTKAQAHKGQTLVGKVIGVHDGDTITVLVGNTQYKVRLNAVDTPESRQAFGTQAKKFTSDLVFGKTVSVTVTDIDHYGRNVGDVMIGNLSLQQELLRAGMAWHYKQYSKDLTLARLEQEARNARKGLWADVHPQAPWDWRRAQKLTQPGILIQQKTYR